MNPHPATLFAFFVVILNFTTLGCAIFFPSNVPPGWVDGESKKFPKTQYIVGVGEGDSRVGAEQQSYAAVIQNFQHELETQHSIVGQLRIQEGRGRIPIFPFIYFEGWQ